MQPEPQLAANDLRIYFMAAIIVVVAVALVIGAALALRRRK
jgi:signal transduction histidine kinase